ncbi:MAG: NAD(P)H-dependent glycerol-3-phosphate dehydrogenase [Hahellaceae bacterium]|nr:NAD(P)H-dependent glycerol-3-phosphate dehydrogenase [Hahellaceae bacterium]
MSERRKVAILGGGSFGTAIANIAAENGVDVSLWMRDSLRADEINTLHENKRYLPGYILSHNLVALTSLQQALSDADVVFFSIPSKSFRDVVQQCKAFLTPEQFVVSTTKGIEAESFKLMSEILAEEFPNNALGVLSGPNLAKEIAKHCLTATVIASTNEDLRNRIQDVLGCSYFRVYANLDTYGVELGGALKNIYAIISGLADALKMGENTKSMLITRSLAEMSRFAVCLGANPMTFLGLAGVGDLIVTCSSPLSRNYRVGFALGEGRALDEAVDELGEVAEGVNTLHLVKAKAESLGIYMPLVDGLHAIIFENKSVKDVISKLMLAQQSTDVEFILPREQVQGN